jgi:hypothetical protein
MYIWTRVGRDRETDFEKQRWGTLSYNVMTHSHHQQRADFEYCNHMGRNPKVTISLNKILLEKLLVVQLGKVLAASYVKREVSWLCSQSLIICSTLRKENHIFSH